MSGPPRSAPPGFPPIERPATFWVFQSGTTYSAVRHGCFSVDGAWLAAGRAGAIHATAETLQKMKVGITGVTYTRKSQRLLGESSGWMAE